MIKDDLTNLQEYFEILYNTIIPTGEFKPEGMMRIADFKNRLDSLILNVNKENNCFDDIVSSLKQDAIDLQNKFSTLKNDINDIKPKIDILRLLKDTLNLIKEYDWKLMYSEYEARQNPNEDFHKEVTVWEQNSEGNIRNHKVWKVYKKDNTEMCGHVFKGHVVADK